MSGAVWDKVAPFFEQKTKKRSLRPQFLIVFVAGIAFALDMGAVYVTMDEAVSVYGPILIILMIAYTITPIIVWFLMAFGVYFIGRVVGARISFGVFFRTAGWGMVPMIGVGSLMAAGRYLTLSSKEACDHPAVTCDLGAYVELQAQVNGVYGFASTATGEPVFQAAFTASLLLLSLVGYLWVVAAEESTTLTRAGATIAVGIPLSLVAGGFVALTL